MSSAIRDEADPNTIKPPNYIANVVPEAYYELMPLFAKSMANKLPSHRYMDYEILITKKPPMGWMYSMSDSELAEDRQ